MSLSDPLTLLREFTITKRPIELQGEHLVFGSTRFARSAQTAYREKGGTGEYYAIDSLWFLLENVSEKHGIYVQKCSQQGVKPVSLPDRKLLLQYLNGEVSESSSVDYARYKPAQACGSLIMPVRCSLVQRGIRAALVVLLAQLRAS